MISDVMVEKMLSVRLRFSLRPPLSSGRAGTVITEPLTIGGFEWNKNATFSTRFENPDGYSTIALSSSPRSGYPSPVAGVVKW